MKEQLIKLIEQEIQRKADMCRKVYGTCSDGSCGACMHSEVTPLEQLLEWTKEKVNEN